MSFQLTEAELLDNRLTHVRFEELLNQRDTAIYEVDESSNAYGAFLFVTLIARLPRVMYGAPEASKRRILTFWGLGFHESRERWLTDEWRWFEAMGSRTPAQRTALSKPQSLAQINAHLATCKMEAAVAEPPSPRASAFSFFAEMMDEDGALTELEDLESLGIDLEGLFDE